MQVASIGRVYVKATQFLTPSAVDVDEDGIRHDRAFALIEGDDKFVGSDEHRTFLPLRFDYDPVAESLLLELPDGRRVEGPATAGARRFGIDHFGLRTIEVAEVEGPWREALSTFAGRPIGLARCLTAQRAIDVFPVTLVTTGALACLARQLDAVVDPVRFRAGLVIDEQQEHAEDGWDGRRLQVGEAVLRVRTSVPRCAIPGFNPRTGERDQDVMKSLMRYRDKVGLPDGLLPGYATPGFASYAEVLKPGRVAVGDVVALLD
ncbi:MAG: MOSC domain-containing protein [Gammaproteobacteria bacterium]